MDVGSNSGLTLDQVQALINAQPTQYVSSAPMTVANVLANYPASAPYLGKYAVVTDLWGSVNEVMRCCSDGSTFYWRPQRTDYAVTSTQTSGSMTLTPLFTAPEIALQSTLVGAMTITPSTANVWPGCQFKVRAPTSLGLFGITITGLIGGLTASLLGGSDKTLVYTATGWRA